MTLKIIKDLKPERFKAGGLLYIHRNVDIDEGSDERLMLEMVKEQKERVQRINKTESNVLDKAKAAFMAISTGEGKTELTGSDEDIVETLKLISDREINYFSDLNMAYGDEVIFLPFTGEFNKRLTTELTNMSMLVMKDMSTGYSIGIITVSKLLNDFEEIKNSIRTEV